MSDRMHPIPFEALMEWLLTEEREQGTVFGVRKKFQKSGGAVLKIFDETLEMPCGPAAGPHTQLAQNIIAAYVAGGRFFELKTVQILDGNQLHVEKPCIRAVDEGYNVEWSTELTVEQALAEYVKAWLALKVLSVEWQLGSPDGFVFNMSVGYDLEGIQSPKIDAFIEHLKDASMTPVWQDCQAVLQAHLEWFKTVDAAYLAGISPQICRSITLSTMHGCQPQEIERIASYLLRDKQLHTFIKCNPTLLGFDFARRTLDRLGYDYLVFDEHHFRDDLHFDDALPMLRRLQQLARQENLEFGVKLTNTFPVDICQDELPGQEMYMSGRALFPLTISVADKIAQAMDGQIRISYSGGADAHNIGALFAMGIWPVTLATNLLKPGGYDRLQQLAWLLKWIPYKEFTGIDTTALHRFARAALEDDHYRKDIRPLPVKRAMKPPLLDCFLAPCRYGCPIHQDIPAYLRLTAAGHYLEALQVITRRNPLPFITGTTCYHSCMEQCMRNFYDAPVNIRGAKLAAAEQAFDALLAGIPAPDFSAGKKVAIIGGGPAGLAAGCFFVRAGWQAVVFEKTGNFGGMICKVVPELRGPDGAAAHDLELVRRTGVQLEANVEKISVHELQQEGYDAVVLAIGAWKPKRRVDAEFYLRNGLAVDADGRPQVDAATLETNLPGVYAIGDGCHGPAGTAAAVADAIRCSEAATGKCVGGWPETDGGGDRSQIIRRHGVVMEPEQAVGGKSPDSERSAAEVVTPEAYKAGGQCLECAVLCETCVEVCPNRANVAVQVPDQAMPQIVHIDGLCNECGNCAAFCPYEGAPYQDKFTLFGTELAFADSRNDGFLCVNRREQQFLVRLDGQVHEAGLQSGVHNLPAAIEQLLRTVLEKYVYLFYEK